MTTADKVAGWILPPGELNYERFDIFIYHCDHCEQWHTHEWRSRENWRGPGDTCLRYSTNGGCDRDRQIECVPLGYATPDIVLAIRRKAPPDQPPAGDRAH